MRNAQRHRENQCKGCHIHRKFCICDSFVSLDTDTHFSLIMHFRERVLSSNSANIFLKQFNNTSTTIRGLREVQELELKDDYTPLFLFPSEKSVELNSEFVASLDKPVQLIVPDGSWNQCKKFHRRIPQLKNVQAVHLPPGYKSRYLMRTKDEDNFLCTFEAMFEAIKIIEPQRDLSSVNNVFERFISAHMRTRITDDRVYFPLMDSVGIKSELSLKGI